MSVPEIKTSVVFGFNRYMVECEYRRTDGSGKRNRGFNRYMVECECVMTSRTCQYVRSF